MEPGQKIEEANYAVVDFLDEVEDGICASAVVPISWTLEEEGKCYWPKEGTKTSKKLKKYAPLPDNLDEWHLVNAKIVITAGKSKSISRYMRGVSMCYTFQYTFKCIVECYNCLSA